MYFSLSFDDNLSSDPLRTASLLCIVDSVSPLFGVWGFLLLTIYLIVPYHNDIASA